MPEEKIIHERTEKIEEAFYHEAWRMEIEEWGGRVWWWVPINSRPTTRGAVPQYRVTRGIQLVLESELKYSILVLEKLCHSHSTERAKNTSATVTVAIDS